jgi:hypothetical protein
MGRPPHKENVMKSIATLCLALLLPMSSFANPPQEESCEQIRIRIASQTGVLPKPDAELLKTLGSRQDCRFTTAEVYRAGFGDLPKAPYEPPYHREHDDD